MTFLFINALLEIIKVTHRIFNIVLVIATIARSTTSLNSETVRGFINIRFGFQRRIAGAEITGKSDSHGILEIRRSANISGAIFIETLMVALFC